MAKTTQLRFCFLDSTRSKILNDVKLPRRLANVKDVRRVKRSEFDAEKVA